MQKLTEKNKIERYDKKNFTKKQKEQNKLIKN